MAKSIFKELKEKVMRDEILDRGQRLDGRAFDEVRPIWSEVGVLPRTHGSTGTAAAGHALKPDPSASSGTTSAATR
jgi:exosome complex RNA-binding protein Rrp42 (RNase PH superfamily)